MDDPGQDPCIPTPFDRLETAASEGGLRELFDALETHLRSEKRHAQLFDALLLRKRHELGLPLEGAESVRELPEDVQLEAESCYIRLSREIGELFLGDGDIPGAWPYFRAIEEPWQAEKAIAAWAPPEAGRDGETDSSAAAKIDAMIEIALTGGAHPRKGFELALARHGVARALEALDREVAQPGDLRESCVGRLVRHVYDVAVARIREEVAGREGRAPEEENLRQLLQGHAGVAASRQIAVEESHLRGAVRAATGVRDRDTLELAVELCECGRLLFPDPHGTADTAPSPFDDFWADARIFLLALLGTGADGAVRFFRKRAERAFTDSSGRHVTGEALVTLLSGLGRHADAVAAHRKHLASAREIAPTVPSLLRLCEAAGDYEPYLERAREKGDLLEFTVGLVKAAGLKGPSGQPQG